MVSLEGPDHKLIYIMGALTDIELPIHHLHIPIAISRSCLQLLVGIPECLQEVFQVSSVRQVVEIAEADVHGATTLQVYASEVSPVHGAQLFKIS